MNYAFPTEGSAPPSPDPADLLTPSTDDALPIYLMCDAYSLSSHNDISERVRTCRAAVDEVNRIGLVDFLHQDPRPAFILDLDIADQAPSLLQPVYYNRALVDTENGGLLTLITGKDNMDIPGAYSVRTYSKFRRWMYTKETDAPRTAGFRYGELRWTRVVMNGRWAVISGMQDLPPSDNGFSEISPGASCSGTPGFRTPAGLGSFNFEYDSRPVHLRTQSDGVVMMQSKTETPEDFVLDGTALSHVEHGGLPIPGPDWTSNNPDFDMSDHIKFARSVDWSRTVLGPMDTWSNALRIMSNLVMRDPNPSVLFWGEDVVMIYNEPYTELLAEMHPGAMGMSAALALADYWDHFVPFINKNKFEGESVKEKNLPLFLVRNGLLQETYFSFTFLPIMDEHGNVVGHQEPVVETTNLVISERRLDTLLQLSEETSTARTYDVFWRSVLQVFATNDKDIPFALLYAVEEDEDSSDSVSVSTTSSPSIIKQCILKGSLGVPEGHAAAPARLDFFQGIEGFMPYFREALNSRRPTLINLDDGTVPASLLDGIQWRGFGDPCRSLVICPITPTTSKNVLGFLIMGLNPRRPYDEDYQQFSGVISRLLATALASVVLIEEEMRQRERMISQAELMKTHLTEQLDISQKEVERNEKKFQRFAERADVAIFSIGADGHYTYRNQAWYEIFQLYDEHLDIKEAWALLCYEEDVKRCAAYFERLMVNKTSVVFELRLKRSWKVGGDDAGRASDDQLDHSVWVLCSAYPELSDTGEVVEILGCVTDISRQKWGEGLQKQRTEDALESKRQLENFIDTTSHEMRNPLSAIIQCADGIITSHSTSTNDPGAPYLPLLESGIDAAQTIVQCSQHMKCIVDDVLTMSKLDSGLLVMTPDSAQPELIGRHAVKMFEAEAKAADVDLSFTIDPSFDQSGLDWASLDPTRLLQVLINLVTNAIKFTRLEETRTVTVSIGASKDRPSTSQVGNVEYIHTATAPEAPSLVADWAKGGTVFLQFTVQDTGRGLSNDEKDLLFARFSQASPRTHVRYGGSGLGLFISRRLTEMQGGAIGFSSIPKVGSTFSFYIKARRSEPPPDLDTSDSLPQIFDTMAIRTTRPLPSPKSPAPPLSDPAKLHTTRPSRRPSMPRRVSSMAEPIHVLLVEDNLINQRVLANQLKSKGCIVSVANHGLEALESLRKTKYGTSPNGTDESLPLDVILMDWEMPIMDGLTAVREIRKMQRMGELQGHVPVIAVTANVRSEQVSKAMDAGMDDVVSKPFRVPELILRMQTLMAKLGG